MNGLATLIFCVSTGRGALPVPGAAVTVTMGENRHEMKTDLSGRTAPVCLPTKEPRPGASAADRFANYEACNARVEAEGYEAIEISGIRLYGGVETVENLTLTPAPRGEEDRTRQADAAPPTVHSYTLEGPEATLPAETAVVIPMLITVHMGNPDDTAAPNLTVNFCQYIKNTAACLLCPDWPEAALEACICTIVTFALNRVTSGWYREKGYPFDITSTGEYDLPYTEAGPTFAPINRLVDETFSRYICGPHSKAPVFIPCCGREQGGIWFGDAVALAQNGYTPLQILRRLGGNHLRFVTGEEVQGVRGCYPGTPMRVGDSGAAVRTVARQLERIRHNYPAIPLTAVSNHYTAETAAAVLAFQRIFGLTARGTVDCATWYRLAEIYLAVRRLAALDTMAAPIHEATPATVREGSAGDHVAQLQCLLAVNSGYNCHVRPVEVDGVFGPETTSAVTDFQNYHSLEIDGIAGPHTWQKLRDCCLGIGATAGLVVAKPQKPVAPDAHGDSIWLIQDYLEAISRSYPLQAPARDGIFGPETSGSVAEFQRLFGLEPTGVLDPAAWEQIVDVRMRL